VNNRQFAIYLVDCTQLDCKEEMRIRVGNLAAKHSDKMAVKFYGSEDAMSQQEYTEGIVNKVVGLIKSEFSADEEYVSGMREGRRVQEK
jgi:hypothetical protein